MKTMIPTLTIMFLSLLPLSSLAQTDDVASIDDVDLDTTYIVYLGTYNNTQDFDCDEVPYELIDIIDNKCRHMYFFGKFKTRCGAEHVKNLVELAGYKRPRVREYIDYRDNPDVEVYAQVCR